MSIDLHAGHSSAIAPPSPTWGELVPLGQVALAIRFVLVDRVVCFPCHQLQRWEHLLGLPETLVIATAKEQVVVEGRDLGEVRAALDLGRLAEIRSNHPGKSGRRPGPQIRAINLEAS